MLGIVTIHGIIINPTDLAMGYFMGKKCCNGETFYQGCFKWYCNSLSKLPLASKIHIIHPPHSSYNTSIVGWTLELSDVVWIFPRYLVRNSLYFMSKLKVMSLSYKTIQGTVLISNLQFNISSVLKWRETLGWNIFKESFLIFA